MIPPLVTTTGLVHLVVTVTDHHHNFITDLDKGDFKVLENGMPQEIKFFGRPMTVETLIFTMANHMHEHLGQSIAYARVNGIVPPWSAKE